MMRNQRAREKEEEEEERSRKKLKEKSTNECKTLCINLYLAFIQRYYDGARCGRIEARKNLEFRSNFCKCIKVMTP